MAELYEYRGFTIGRCTDIDGHELSLYGVTKKTEKGKYLVYDETLLSIDEAKDFIDSILDESVRTTNKKVKI